MITSFFLESPTSEEIPTPKRDRSSMSTPRHQGDRILATSEPRLDFQNDTIKETIYSKRATSLDKEIVKSSSLGDVKQSKLKLRFDMRWFISLVYKLYHLKWQCINKYIFCFPSFHLCLFI